MDEGVNNANGEEQDAARDVGGGGGGGGRVGMWVWVGGGALLSRLCVCVICSQQVCVMCTHQVE